MKRLINTLYSKFEEYKLEKNIHKYGLEAIKVFSELASKNNWDYSLGFGTLLGAYREKDFIKHDDDIDMIGNRKDITPDLIQKMQQAGFEFEGLYMSSNGEFAHPSFKYHNITFDIYGFNVNYHGGDSVIFAPFPPEGSDWNESAEKNYYQVCRIHFDYKGTETTIFKGVPCKVLANTKEFLTSVYGEDFMIPQRKKGVKSPCYEYVPLTEMTASKVEVSQLLNG